MLRSIRRSGDKRKVDVGGGSGRKLFLCLLSSLFQSLHGHLIAGQIHALCLLKLVNHPLDHGIIEVIAAQMGVAVGGKHFDYAIADLDDGDIESTAA